MKIETIVTLGRGKKIKATLEVFIKQYFLSYRNGCYVATMIINSWHTMLSNQILHGTHSFAIHRVTKQLQQKFEITSSPQ